MEAFCEIASFSLFRSFCDRLSECDRRYIDPLFYIYIRKNGDCYILFTLGTMDTCNAMVTDIPFGGLGIGSIKKVDPLFTFFMQQVMPTFFGIWRPSMQCKFFFYSAQWTLVQWIKRSFHFANGFPIATGAKVTAFCVYIWLDGDHQTC